jgi:hypothetical protein
MLPAIAILETAPKVIYRCPGMRVARVTIRGANSSGNGVMATIYLTSSGTRVPISQVPMDIPGGGGFRGYDTWTMREGDFLEGEASINGALSVVVDGFEERDTGT